MRPIIGPPKDLVPLSLEEWITKHFSPRGADAVAGAHNVVELITTLGGTAVVSNLQASIVAKFTGDEGKPIYPFHLARDGGKFTISFSDTKHRAGLKDEAIRDDLLRKFEAALGPLAPCNTGGYPGIAVAKLSDPTAIARMRPIAEEYLSLARLK